MDSDEYQLTIISANQKVDDYSIKCKPNWNVKRLKQHISETHINKPNIEDQRLIYAGNILKDHQILKQIFFRDSLCTELTNSSKTDFTVHIVCAQNKLTSSSTGRGNDKAHASNNQLASSPQTATTSNNLTLRPNQPSTANELPSAARAATTGGNIQANPSNVQAHINETLVFGPAERAEMIQNVMQSEQMRQQMVVFQQLACMVAARIASNINVNTQLTSSLSGTTAATSASATATTIINGASNQISTFFTNPIGTDNVTPPFLVNNNPNHLAATQLLYAAANRQQAQTVQSNNNEPNNNHVEPQNQAQVNPANAQFGFGNQIHAPAPVVEQPPAAARIDQDAMAGQRDVIDWVYYTIRAFVLVAALYIHASMFRLLFIVSLLAIAYFFNRRSARRNNMANNRQEAAAAPAAARVRAQMAEETPNVPRANDDLAQNELRHRNVGNQNNAEGGENPLGAEGAGEHQVRGGEAEIVEQVGDRAPDRLPILKLCYLVLTDFFYSLLPDR